MGPRKLFKMMSQQLDLGQPDGRPSSCPNLIWPHLHVGPRPWPYEVWSWRWPPVRLSQTKLLRHHFEELSWTLLPNHGFKAILVYVGGLDWVVFRGALHLLWSFMLGLGGGHMRFGHEDGLPSGCPKPSCWDIILKSFLAPSSRITVLKQF